MPYHAWFTAHPHRPENDDVGDADPANIFLAVGQVTHAWECLESSLATLFTIVTESTTAANMMAFGSVLSSGSRIAMVNSAWNGYSWAHNKQNLTPNLNVLLSNVKKLTGLRNIAAHGMVANLENQSFTPAMNGDALGQYYIIPALYNTSKLTDRLGVKLWWNSNTILEIRDCINQTKFDIDIFTWHDLIESLQIVPPMRASASKSPTAVQEI
ncbi:hypothetical protein [Novosphingobium sp.]|uniref:hypothetical protein n=1 Tax=Novosphingobium sp. TaxID=1874826 RepID=UPI003D0E166B